MSKKHLVVGMVGLLVAALFALSLPAGASVTGGAEFTCTVKLPVWPTGNGPAVNCNGKATGLIEGKTTTGAQYEAIAANDNLVGAASTYKETCTANEPLNGTAKGTFNISGMQSVSPAGAAKSSAPFNWTRVGVTAVITLGVGTVTLPQNKIAKGKSGVAVAAFIPTSTPGNCSAPKPLTALIAGVAEFTQ